MLIVSGLEGYRLVEWGQKQAFIGLIKKFTPAEAVVFEAAQFIFSLGVIATCGCLVKMQAATFHRRHTYRQAFTLVIYAFGPLFLLQVLNALPGLTQWVPWAIGVALSIEVLYQGIPIVMEPDPPTAFGLYLMSSLVIFAATGFERFVTYWCLTGHSKPVMNFISTVAANLPL